MNIVDAIIAQARATPGAPAVLTTEGTLSYAELERAIYWSAAELRRAGIAAGDHVAITLSSQPQYLVSSLALAHIGAGQIGLHAFDPPRLKEELARRLHLAATISDSPELCAGARLEPPPPDLRSLAALSAPPTPPVSAADLPFLIKRSSGTTRSLVKLGLVTHGMGVPSADEFPRQVPRGAGCRFMVFSPLGFSAATNHVPRILSTGGCLAFPDGIARAREMLEFITRHRLNFLAGGPVHVRQLLELAKDGELLLPEVAAFRVGSTLIHEELRKALTERLTPNLYINYSMSETGGLTLAGPELLRRVPGTVGLALRRVQIEIVDEEGRALPVGEPGRLRAKTPWMVRGYFDDPQETALAFRDGWFVSGDRAHFTVEGALVHHGRADDLMIYDGLNVSPAEIESVLLRHPAVVEAAAFGVRLEPHGDVPVAAVVLKAEVGGDELAEHCRAWIGIRAPQHVLVLPRLPRNAAGKVLTHELRRVFDALAQKRGQKRSS